MREINFSSMCHIFVIPRGLRGHSLVIGYIEVYFTFEFPDYGRYIEEFVISRFVIWRFYSVTLAGT